MKVPHGESITIFYQDAGCKNINSWREGKISCNKFAAAADKYKFVRSQDQINISSAKAEICQAIKSVGD